MAKGSREAYPRVKWKDKLPLPPAKKFKSSPERIKKLVNTGVRKLTKGRRILPDLTANLEKYEDTRQPVMPGTTIKNGFKAYALKPTPYNTVKG